jgi:hypothetical protein
MDSLDSLTASWNAKVGDAVFLLLTQPQQVAAVQVVVAALAPTLSRFLARSSERHSRPLRRRPSASTLLSRLSARRS